MPDLREFPRCCGINVIVNWDGPKRDAIRDLKDAEEQHKEEYSGLLLIALNDIQKNRFHELVLEKGYKVLVKDFNNPITMNKITLYGKVTPNVRPVIDLDDVYHYDLW